VSNLTLYSTDHCSLCDQALDLLLGMRQVAGLQLVVVDIALDDALMARYAQSIPVLRIGEHELHSPFDRDTLATWLQSIEDP